MKYGNWTFGQAEALINKLGENVAEAILRDEVEVVVRDKLRTLFNKNGRRIPLRDWLAVVDPDYGYYIYRITGFDYKERLDRAIQFLDVTISSSEFRDRSNELIGDLRSDNRLKNILNGVYLPIVLPQIPELDDYGDYGKVFVDRFLPAVAKACKNYSPVRKVINYCKPHDRYKSMYMLDGTRHGNLFEMMWSRSVVGIYFPTALQGFSIVAAREQIKTLPKGFLLAGGFDTAAALIMYHDILTRDVHTPSLVLSALEEGMFDESFCFVYGGTRGKGDALRFEFFRPEKEWTWGNISHGLLYVSTK